MEGVQVAQIGKGNVIATLQLALPSATSAANAVQILKVDGPLPNTTRSITQHSHNKNVLCLMIKGASLRALRVAVHAALEQLDLVLRTMEAFDTTAVVGTSSAAALSS